MSTFYFLDQRGEAGKEIGTDQQQGMQNWKHSFFQAKKLGKKTKTEEVCQEGQGLKRLNSCQKQPSHSCKGHTKSYTFPQFLAWKIKRKQKKKIVWKAEGCWKLGLKKHAGDRTQPDQKRQGGTAGTFAATVTISTCFFSSHHSKFILYQLHDRGA